MLYEAPEVPGQEKEPMQRVIHLKRNLFEFFKSTLFNTVSSHHLSCRPSDFIVSEDAEIEYITQDLCIVALAIRRSITTRLDLIHNKDVI
jgi:hypothetical protein